MSGLSITNGNVFLADSRFHKLNIEIKENEIIDVSEDSSSNQNVYDASDCFVIPGLIDTHLHGANGYDFSDGSLEAIKEMAKYELSNGVTSFCPATMTLPFKDLICACKAANEYSKNVHSDYESEFLGIHMEGPFFNKEKKGAQPEEHLLSPDTSFLDRMIFETNLIKIWSLAPELSEGIEFIKYAKKTYPKLSIALGHTCADYEKFCEALSIGANRITHLYNGMKYYDDAIRACLYQQTSLDSASQDSKIFVELICDGIHNDKTRVLNAFNKIGSNNIVLISDSMRATGLPDGKYSLGGQDVYVNGKLALLNNGSKAGSVTNLYDCMLTAVALGVSLEDAITSASITPARSLGLENRIGNIAIGKQADIVILNKDLSIRNVIKNGNCIPVS